MTNIRNAVSAGVSDATVFDLLSKVNFTSRTAAELAMASETYDESALQAGTFGFQSFITS